jgi:triacylglycerol lipase
MKTAFTAFVAIIMALFQSIFGSISLIFASPEPKDCYPIVFVHGLGGWGDGTGVNYLVPHWGMTAGSMEKQLNAAGYKAVAVSVGPVSSAWDRACELYAHLTGTRTDYGAAHSALHNHERYGTDYSGGALLPGFGEDGEKIHLIGHSFGGATARLFAQLCTYGSAEEIAAGGTVSPLFTGELAGCIESITALGAPHNGSSSLEAQIKGDGISNMTNMFTYMGLIGSVLQSASFFYPYRLEHFGINTSELFKGIDKLTANYEVFNSGTDRAEYDLTLDGAAELNAKISVIPDVYYFSYYAQMTVDDGNGNQIPKSGMMEMFKDSSSRMGEKRDAFTTAGGILVDSSWQANDGLVNVVSAKYPFGDANKSFDAGNIETGVWQVMPAIENWDHIDFIGGFSKIGGADGVKDFYLDLAAMLDELD